MSKIDVLSVGDIVTDEFIRLAEDQAEVYEDDKGKHLAMAFATKLPYDHVEVVKAVGNSPNASVSFAKLGLNSALYANVGGDSHGRDMINALHKADVDTRFVRINPGKKSNHHYILWYKEDRTILIKHEAYDYHWPHLRPTEIPAWIYFSSIGENALDFHDDLSDWLDENPEVKLAFQPGTFQMKAGVERLKRIYARTEILSVNREEAVLISGGKYEDLHDLFDRLHSFGPPIVAISDGPSGSYASDGANRFKMPIYPDAAPPLERTGAGDAFTSTFVAQIIKGNTIEGALQWGPINSMNVVQHVGAQEGLLTEKEIDELLRHAPDSYKPEKF